MNRRDRERAARRTMLRNTKVGEGSRSGMLVVVKRVRGTHDVPAGWLCDCDCGTEGVFKKTASLKSGRTTSCGCRRLASLAANRRALAEPWMATRNYVLSGYRVRARKKGLAFELSAEGCFKLFESPCHYCGVPPSNAVNAYANKDGTPRHGRVRHVTAARIAAATYHHNGIDRLDNTRGYVADNAVPCCWTCNAIKGATPATEFLAWVARLVAHRARESALVGADDAEA